jgi:ribonuclease P protein component
VKRASTTLRFGLVVSRKVGNAVVRNRVKRWLREALRRQLPSWSPGDHAIIARPRAALAGLRALETELVAASRRLSRSSRGGATF